MPMIFDSTGFLPANKIANEAHTVIYAGETIPYLIVPTQAPFYKERFSIVDANGMTLEEGVHFHFTHVWSDGATVLGKQVYGSIALIGLTTSGTYRLNYQAVGGTYPSGNAYATEGFHSLTIGELFLLDWENAPTSFPSTLHTHPLLTGFDGMTQVFEKLDAIAQALGSPLATIKLDDVEDLGPEFISPVLTALDNIILEIAKPAFSQSVIDDVVLKYASLVPWNITNPSDPFYSATNYDIPIAKYFRLKIGKLVYDPQITPGQAGGLPVQINFSTPFAHQCLYVNIVVGINLTAAHNEQHIVTFGKPNTHNINGIEVDCPDNLFPTDDRYLTYIAIGL